MEPVRSKTFSREGHPETFRLHIDGAWTSRDFAEFFGAIDRLYTSIAALLIMGDESRQHFRFLRDYGPPFPFPFPFPGSLTSQFQALESADLVFLAPEQRLAVLRVQYASPGFGDFAGLGEIVGHLKELVLRLCAFAVSGKDRAIDREKRQLENDMLRTQIEASKIENAHRLVALVERPAPIALSQVDRIALTAELVALQEPLARLALEGRLVPKPVELPPLPTPPIEDSQE